MAQPGLATSAPVKWPWLSKQSYITVITATQHPSQAPSAAFGTHIAPTFMRNTYVETSVKNEEAATKSEKKVWEKRQKDGEKN